ncbi:MAG TPA: hypothetical protein VFJ77_01535 [Gaiellaceae bacterium]|nr:hypothetical protein [Gaiellaceae bacterium]
MMDWFRRMLGGGEKTAAKQQGDLEALDTPGDPRGGEQSPEYRHAEPTDVVQEGETVMSGPGGSPPADESAEERRELDRDDPTHPDPA